MAVCLSEQYGTMVINADTVRINRPVSLARGRNLVKLRMNAVHLTPGCYSVGLWLVDPIAGQAYGKYDYLEAVFELEMVNANPEVSYTTEPASLVTCDFMVEAVDSVHA